MKFDTFIDNIKMFNFHFCKASGSICSRLHQRLPNSFNAEASFLYVYWNLYD